MTLSLLHPMDNSVQISGRKLAALRRRRYMTQEEVARGLGISKSRVSAIEVLDEAGLYLKNFKNLAALFKLHPEDLLRELATEATGITLYPIPTGVLDGLKARAALENSTLDEWLERQASLSVEVRDEPGVGEPESRAVKDEKPARGSGPKPRPKRAESQGKSRRRSIR